jgi:hypothetical protein
MFMKKIIVLLWILQLGYTAASQEQPRKPFVILKVNGTEYNEGAEIPVRQGERVQVEAILMGGKRDYCTNPQKYANVGRNTVIESSGENGMSFNINNGQFRGKWTLTSEIAKFTSGEKVKIEVIVGNKDLQRGAWVQLPQGDYSKVFFKVQSQTKWHYIRNTPAGQTTQDETNDGTATFYFVMSQQKDAWFSSTNIIAKGTEDFSVRNRLDDAQKFYKEIETALQKQDYKTADMHINNLKGIISDVKKLVSEKKQKEPKFNCEITFVGLPTDKSMDHLNKINAMSLKWRENFTISQGNAQKINEMLLNKQMVFSANILRSVFKNYINWGTSIPTGAEDILTIYDPKNIFGPIDLPRKLMDWYTTAENDAGILKDQANSIKNMSELREFYLERSKRFVDESKKLNELKTELKPVSDKSLALKQYFSTLGWAKWVSK